MKHTLKKSLAILLAMLMLLGVTATGATATNDATALNDAAAATADPAPTADEEEPVLLASEQLEVSLDEDETGTPEDEPKKLVAPKKITITVGDYVSMETLLAGTTWEISELYFWAKWSEAVEFEKDRSENNNDYIKGFTGLKPGQATVEIMSPDGEYAEIKITVKHIGWNWVKYYLLSGWLVGNDRLKTFWGCIGGGLWSIVLLLFSPLLGLLYLLLLPSFSAVG